MRSVYVWSVAAIASLAAAATSSAAVVLSVDFNGGNSSFLQSTFTAFTVPDGAVASPTTKGPFGGMSVTVAGRNADGSSGGLFSRSRTGPGGTYNDLFRDWIAGPNTGTSSAGRAIQVTVTGLTPNAQYQAQVWSWESSVTATQRVADVTLVSGLPRNVQLGDYSFGTAANPTRASNTLQSPTVMANASGELSLLVSIVSTNQTTSNARPYLSGFEITSVPEPAAVLLLGGAAGGLLVRRRRVA